VQNVVHMAMGRTKAALLLSPQQHEHLESLASSRSLVAGLGSRAKIILLSASGKTNRKHPVIAAGTKCG
jgi:hypothetical protein